MEHVCNSRKLDLLNAVSRDVRTHDYLAEVLANPEEPEDNPEADADEPDQVGADSA